MAGFEVTPEVQLLSWQVAGRSSRPLPNWLLTKVDEITDLVLLDQSFPGGRPTASGKHIEWDVLFIRVKPPTVIYALVPSNPAPSVSTGPGDRSFHGSTRGLGMIYFPEK